MNAHLNRPDAYQRRMRSAAHALRGTLCGRMLSWGASEAHMKPVRSDIVSHLLQYVTGRKL